MKYSTLKRITPVVDNFAVVSGGIYSRDQVMESEIRNAIHNIKRHIEDMGDIVMIPDIVRPEGYKDSGEYTIIYDKTDGQAYGLHVNGNEYELSVNLYTIIK